MCVCACAHINSSGQVNLDMPPWHLPHFTRGYSPPIHSLDHVSGLPHPLQARLGRVAQVQVLSPYYYLVGQNIGLQIEFFVLILY